MLLTAFQCVLILAFAPSKCWKLRTSSIPSARVCADGAKRYHRNRRGDDEPGELHSALAPKGFPRKGEYGQCPRSCEGDMLSAQEPRPCFCDPSNCQSTRAAGSRWELGPSHAVSGPGKLFREIFRGSRRGFAQVFRQSLHQQFLGYICKVIFGTIYKFSELFITFSELFLQLSELLAKCPRERCRNCYCNRPPGTFHHICIPDQLV